MENQLKVRRKDTYLIPFGLLTENPDNVRTEYGDLEELAKSIESQGLQVPLTVKKLQDGRYMVTDGHRRYRAMAALVAKGLDVGDIETRLQVGNSDDILFTQLITGTGQKPLTDFEVAEALKQLRSRNFVPEQIATKIGKSITYVNNMLAVADMPNVVKVEAQAVGMSALTTTQVFKVAGEDTVTALETINTAAKDAKEKGNKKVTAKNVAALKKVAEKKTQTLETLLAEVVEYLDAQDRTNTTVEKIAHLLNVWPGKTVEEIADFLMD